MRDVESIRETDIKDLHIRCARRETRDPIKIPYYLELVWYHSVFVGKIALQLAKAYQDKSSIEINKDLVKKGALVHDIGLYSVFDRHEGLSSDKNGCWTLDREGFPLDLVVFPLASSSPEYRNDILKQMQVGDDYLVPTIEEMLIRHANSFHSVSPQEPGFRSMKEARNKKKASKLSGRRFLILLEEFGVPDLSALKEESVGWHEKMRKHYVDFA